MNFHQMEKRGRGPVFLENREQSTEYREQSTENRVQRTDNRYCSGEGAFLWIATPCLCMGRNDKRGNLLLAASNQLPATSDFYTNKIIVMG